MKKYILPLILLGIMLLMLACTETFDFTAELRISNKITADTTEGGVPTTVSSSDFATTEIPYGETKSFLINWNGASTENKKDVSITSIATPYNTYSTTVEVEVDYITILELLPDSTGAITNSQ